MSSFCSPRWWPWSRTCIGATGPMSVSISPESSPWCAEAQALPGALVSCTELVSSSAQVVPLVLMGIGFGSRESQGSPVSMTDGEPRGRPPGSGPVSVSQVPGPQCAEAQALPNTLVSCTELCELFCPGGPSDIDRHRW
ncbi:uncharacterized protein LOC129013542 isoform X2 [Pongo pygmaeus]|uniref:uncharacterized protein LOC129013542 isoform X2 n=1 Tax=Pongo pygmaeus TaxID=9600 RepID=UPI00300CC49E